MTDHAAKLRGLDRYDLYGSDWDILTSAADRIVCLEAALQEIASSDDMYEPASWAIHTAREALKPKP
jgi:hypothetical protein